MPSDNPIINMIERGAKAREMTNAQLVWALMQTTIWAELEIGSCEDAILQEITDRLYPDFDGETVVPTARGWKTPEGEINYV